MEDAVYWLMYLDSLPAREKLSKKAARFRLARRILIGSAEDGHSIAVMESVATNFQFLCRLDSPLVYLAAEIVGFASCQIAGTRRQYPSEQGHFFHRSDCMLKWRHTRYESGF